jgi:hypothetical protein
MSAHQMMCHLADAFRMATGEKAVSEAPSVLPRPLVRWIALYLPMRWPQGIQTRPEVDQCLGDGTRPTQFAIDVARVEQLVEVITGPAPRFTPVHPNFGRMSSAAWLRWGYLHTDHHLRQFGV